MFALEMMFLIIIYNVDLFFGYVLSFEVSRMLQCISKTLPSIFQPDGQMPSDKTIGGGEMHSTPFSAKLVQESMFLVLYL